MLSPVPPGALLADPAYPRLKALIIETTGLAYYDNRDEDLAGRVGRRLSHLGLRDCGSYLNIFDSPAKDSELDALVAELTIGETYFFRYREQFDAMRDTIFPDLIRRQQDRRRLRIWSAGCASGAEPYSLAILLKREFGLQVAGWDINILGTDINRDFLARAGEGRFQEWALRSVSEEIKHSCFSRVGKDWTVLPEYREWVSFQYHNLVDHPFPSMINNLFALDLILCRNVMIYFSVDIINRLSSQFRQSLLDGGWLLVGHAEPNSALFSSFHMVSAPGAFLYQKIGEDHRATAPINPRVASWTLPAAPDAIPAGSATPPPTIRVDVEPPRSPPPREVRKHGMQEHPSNPPSPAARVVPQKIAEEVAPAVDGLSEVRSLADQGEWQPALEECKKLLHSDRLNPIVHLYHALLLEQTGEEAGAEGSLRSAIYLDRGCVLAHYHLGLFYQKRKDTANASRSLRNVLALLSRMDNSQVFADADGITAAELKQLTEMHLEVLSKHG